MIKRYRKAGDYMDRDQEDGDWVLYSDHLRAVAEARTAALEEAAKVCAAEFCRDPWSNAASLAGEIRALKTEVTK